MTKTLTIAVQTVLLTLLLSGLAFAPITNQGREKQHQQLIAKLTSAVRSGNKAEVENLLSAHKVHKNDLDAVMLDAIRNDRADIVSVLLNAGARCNAHYSSAGWFTGYWYGVSKRRGMLPGQFFLGPSMFVLVVPPLGSLHDTLTAIKIGTELKPEVMEQMMAVDIPPQTFPYVFFFGHLPQTALNIAATEGYTDVLKVLLAAGADKCGFAANYMGQLAMPVESKLHKWGFVNYQMMTVVETAVQAAREGGHKDIVALLGDEKSGCGSDISPNGNNFVQPTANVVEHAAH
jgi:ankyrin repeat protein